MPVEHAYHVEKEQRQDVAAVPRIFALNLLLGTSNSSSYDLVGLTKYISNLVNECRHQRIQDLLVNCKALAAFSSLPGCPCCRLESVFL
jgi:hypothetical protein